MGKAVKTKKELDENKRAWESTTLKIGLVSSIVTVLNLILDGISIFYVNRLVFAIIGIIVAVILVIVFSSKKLEKKIDKIKNKELNTTNQERAAYSFLNKLNFLVI